MTSDPEADLAANIRELTAPYQHDQPYAHDTQGRRWHSTNHPSLLHQLAAAAGATGTVPETSGHSSSTRLPANPEALDALAGIYHDTQRWTGTRSRTLDALTAQIAALPDATPDRDRQRLAHDVARWHHTCETHTAWTDRAWRPYAPCPRCGHLAGDIDGHPVGLRVTTDGTREGTTARCVTQGCDGRWDRNTIGILMAHIRAYTTRPRPEAA